MMYYDSKHNCDSKKRQDISTNMAGWRQGQEDLFF